MIETKIYREATISDMPQINLLTVASQQLEALAKRSLGRAAQMLNGSRRMWVCEIENRLVGVAVADTRERPQPFILVHPKFKDSGITEKLGEMALDSFFGKIQKNILPLAKG